MSRDDTTLNQTRFFNLDDRPVVQPDDVVIVCAFWRDAAIGARQTRCETCDCLLGVSRERWQYRQEHPLTSRIVCLDCQAEHKREQRERAQQRAERIREHAPKRKARSRRVQ